MLTVSQFGAKSACQLVPDGDCQEKLIDGGVRELGLREGGPDCGHTWMQSRRGVRVIKVQGVPKRGVQE